MLNNDDSTYIDYDEDERRGIFNFQSSGGHFEPSNTETSSVGRSQAPEFRIGAFSYSSTYSIKSRHCSLYGSVWSLFCASAISYYHISRAM